MNRTLQHPEISMALATGYPDRQETQASCDCCGETMTDYWEIDGMNVCEYCMVAIATEELRDDHDKAALFIGAERRMIS